ncbi:MAG: hypothetical protein HW403_761, partial [Dehalococcoidia bacterium]|nr:hypothetical protein [Dehalococcoidia bacterium]
EEAILYRTIDAGQTWQRLALPPPYKYISQMEFVNENTGWVAAGVLRSTGDGTGRIAIIRTDDGGHTWSLELEVSESGHCVDCGLFNGLLYFINERLGWTAIGEWNPIVCCYYRIYKHYPNIGLTPTPTPTPTPGPNARESVIWRAYWETLCRNAEQQAYLYWLNSPLTTGEIKSQLVNSSEGQRVQGVRGLYLSVLARDPISFVWDISIPLGWPTGGDCNGLRFWVNSSLGAGEIASTLAGTGEGQRVASVRQLYIELLGRDPLGSDNAGLRYWVQLPLPISEIRRLIMESEEHRRRAPVG